MEPSLADSASEGIPAGLFASLRSMMATLVELGHARLELAMVEVEEELHRVALTLLWSVIAAFAAGLALLLLSLTIVIACWDSHRLLAAGAVTALFALGAGYAAWVVRGRLALRAPLLSSSLGELRRDAATLRGNP